MIDAHLHVVPTNLPGTGALHKLLTESPEVIAAALKEAMRSAGLTTAFAMPEWNAPEDDPLGIGKTLRVVELVPGLRPVGIADPTRGDDPGHLKRVEALLTRGRVAALKCYLGYLHYEPAHPNYRRYYELAAQFKLPVIFHTGDTYSPQAKLKFAHPLGVDEVAVDHPEVRFVLAHLGNPWTAEAAEVVYKNVNVWADLSGLVVGDETAFAAEEHRDALADLARQVRRAFRYAERPNRFVFGTDWPLAPTAPYKQFVASVIPSAHHPQVFEENARLLFRLGA